MQDNKAAEDFRQYILNYKPRDPATIPIYELQFLYGYLMWTKEDFEREVERRKYNAANGKTDT